MEDSNHPTEAPPTPGGLTQSSLGRVLAVLWKPRETFTAIAARPTWGLALLIIVLFSAISAAIWIPSIDVAELIRERIASSGQNVDAARLETIIEMTSRMRWVMFLGPVIVFQPIAVAVVAFVFYLVFRVTGSEQRYQQSLAVTAHSFLPLAVAALLSIPLLLSRGSMSTEELMAGGALASNLAFLAGEDASPAMFAFLQSLDFFSLWSLVLLGIGYVRTTGLPRLSVAISVVAMWGLWILARVGMAQGRELMKRALLTIAVLVVLGGIFAASFVRRNGQSRGVEVRAEKVERRDITHVVKASGQIDPRVKVNVSAHVVARIEKLHAREGDQVVAGQPFIELEKENFVAAHDRAKAQLAMATTAVRQAEIDLADAGLKLRRTQRLREEQVVPDEKLEAAELAESSARLRVDQSNEQVSQARADLEKALDELRKTTIHAPITGRVIMLNAEEGEVVVSGTMHNEASVIGVIADLSEILVEVLADETDIVQIQLGQPAEIAVDALPAGVYTGKVVEIGNAGVSLTTQPDVTFFRVKVLLDDPDARLLSGMSARASIEVAGHDATLVVPIESVIFRPPANAAEGADEVQVVLIAKDDGTVEQRPVEVGISDVTHVEIVDGVKEGEQVITGPHRVLEDLKPSDHVRIATGEAVEEEPERGGFGPFD